MAFVRLLKLHEGGRVGGRSQNIRGWGGGVERGEEEEDTKVLVR